MNLTPFRQPYLSGSNGFHVKAANEIFMAAGSYCRQNLKLENFTSSFGRPRQKVAPKACCLNSTIPPCHSANHIIDL